MRGIFAFIAFSTFQNAGMTMGIMPITGIPLPFLSYGGSAVLSFFVGVGITLNVFWRRGVSWTRVGCRRRWGEHAGRFAGSRAGSRAGITASEPARAGGRCRSFG